MWGDAKLLRELRDEMETQRRTVEALKYDLQELKDRVQRALWREKAQTRARNGPAAEAEVEVDASGTHSSLATDPVSQALHARRRRYPLVPIPPPKNGDSGES